MYQVLRVAFAEVGQPHRCPAPLPRENPRLDNRLFEARIGFARISHQPSRRTGKAGFLNPA
jgi:hypothetical protein